MSASSFVYNPLILNGMNILFFYESANCGGQQTQTYNLVKRLAKKGHQVSWVYLYGSGIEDAAAAYATVEKIPIPLRPKEYRRKPWKLLTIGGGLFKFCRANEIEVIISGSGIGSLVCGWVARRLGIQHYRLVGGSLKQIGPTLYRIYPWIRIDALIDGYFGWPAVFEELESKGVSSTKFVELQNAVDTDMFFPLPSAERERVRSSLGIQTDEVVIGWIGRIARNMQVWSTVELAGRLRETGFDRFKLLFVGGGPDFDDLKTLVSQTGLDRVAIYTDWLPMTEVNRFVNAMDVVPLLEADPQGGSIVREAMACGRVALSVDGESATQRRFMLPDCSILVSPDNYVGAAAEAILDLVANDQLENMGRKARLYAEKHMSFEAQVQAILNTVQRNPSTGQGESRESSI